MCTQGMYYSTVHSKVETRDPKRKTNCEVCKDYLEIMKRMEHARILSFFLPVSKLLHFHALCTIILYLQYFKWIMCISQLILLPILILFFSFRPIPIHSLFRIYI